MYVSQHHWRKTLKNVVFYFIFTPLMCNPWFSSCGGRDVICQSNLDHSLVMSKLLRTTGTLFISLRVALSLESSLLVLIFKRITALPTIRYIFFGNTLLIDTIKQSFSNGKVRLSMELFWCSKRAEKSQKININ